jgi:hypothetical protein
VWILCGFAAVFLNNLFSRSQGVQVSMQGDVVTFLEGPVWFFAIAGDFVGQLFSRR